jgi:hypothetical protein
MYIKDRPKNVSNLKLIFGLKVIFLYLDDNIFTNFKDFFGFDVKDMKRSTF